MNPCPHPVHSAERAGRELVVAWAGNVIEAGGAPPSPAELAAAYLEVRDAVLASPPTSSRPTLQSIVVGANQITGGPE